MFKTVSVIVAIYNVGEYLEQCIESIINQTYNNLDIILVDDGSTDIGPTICDKFQQRDDRITVIHKKNEGCVYARRDGVIKATGEYVLFVDGDDWLDKSYIKNLYEKIVSTDSDVVVDSFLMSFPDSEHKKRSCYSPGVYKGDKLSDLKKYIIYSGKYFEFGINPALWNKLFKRQKLLKHQARISQWISLGEDFALSVPYMMEADTITIIDSDAYYHYRQSANSMVNAYNPKLNESVDILINDLDNNYYLKPYDVQLRYYYSWIFISCLNNAYMSSNRSNEAIDAIKKTFLNFRRKDVVNLNRISLKYSLVFWGLKHRLYRFVYLLMKVKNK